MERLVLTFIMCGTERPMALQVNGRHGMPHLKGAIDITLTWL
jgi:hypothetical protein